MSDSQLRHVVLFAFADGTSKETVASIEDAFRALPEKIPGIKGFEWGTNVSPAGHDHGYTHCFFLTFASEAERDAYLPHPEHAAFGELLRPHLQSICVVDYWSRD